jgi:hypothetical protein
MPIDVRIIYCNSCNSIEDLIEGREYIKLAYKHYRHPVIIKGLKFDSIDDAKEYYQYIKSNLEKRWENDKLIELAKNLKLTADHVKPTTGQTEI